jgi:hypothetical protein
MDRIRIALATAGALAVVTGGAVYASTSDGGDLAPPASTSSAGTPAGAAGSTPAASAPGSRVDSAPTLPPVLISSTSPTGAPAAPAATSQLLLWPFRTVAEADTWTRDSAPGGHQPWHLDAGQTALTFTRTFLGFTELDRVVSSQVVGTQAWVGVGYRDPAGTDRAAAVLHLVRTGTGASDTRPWEVVGSRDTSLTLEQPRYGSTVRSSVTAAGRITGVDESLVVTVRATDGTVAGRLPGLPAGGENRPWGPATVPIHARPGATLTVVVSTGGHLLGVERFAITGVTASWPAGSPCRPTTAAAGTGPPPRPRPGC